jgi:hypothetical protein
MQEVMEKKMNATQTGGPELTWIAIREAPRRSSCVDPIKVIHHRSQRRPTPVFSREPLCCENDPNPFLEEKKNRKVLRDAILSRIHGFNVIE